MNKDEIGFEVTALAAMILDEDLQTGVLFDKMKDKLTDDSEAVIQKFEAVKKLVSERHEALKQQRGRRLSIGKRMRGESGEERSSSRQRVDN